MKRFRLSWLIDGLGAVLALTLIAAVAINFVNMAMRYLFGGGFLSGDEIQVYLMVGIAFLGAILVTARDAHLRMDVIVQASPRGLRRALDIAEGLLLAAVGGLTAWHSGAFVAKIWRFGQVSDMAEIPMWLPHGTVMFGFGAMAAWGAARAVRAALGHPSPRHRDPS